MSKMPADWEVAMAAYRGELRHDIAARLGVSYSSVYVALKRWVDAGGEPFPDGRHKDKGISERTRAIVDLYQSGKSLREVGALYGMTFEGIRQIIVEYERRTGSIVERHRRGGPPGPKVPRVLWTCRECGAQRQVRARALKTAPATCRKCRWRRRRPAPELIESWIEQRRIGVPMAHIARSAGYNRQQSHYPMRYIAIYLRDAGRIRDLIELQRGRSLRWLVRYVPELSESLAAEQQ